MMKKWARWFGGGSQPDPVVTDGTVDLLSDDFLADPYPIYAALRDQYPLAEVTSGGFLLTRHADVVAAFSNKSLGNAPSRFSALAAKNRDKYTAASVAAHIPPFLDMPDHRLPRQALTRSFFDSFKVHEAALPGLAQQMVQALPSGEIEVIRDISSPFALRSMAGFVGLDAEPARLKEITHAFFRLFAPISDPAAFAETNALLDQARVLVMQGLEARKADRGDDLISGLLRFQDGAPDLTDAQIVDCALLVFADGIENIEAGAATVLHILLSETERPVAPLEAAVREALRLDTPGQIIPRIAKDPVHLHGRDIVAGSPVFLALGSANRDEAEFDAAGSFRLGRENQPVTFGLGRHRCIGEPLGIAQITAVVAALLDRGATLSQPKQKLSYAARFGHRWPTGLSIALP